MCLVCENELGKLAGKSKWAKCQVLSRHRHISTISVNISNTYHIIQSYRTSLKFIEFSTTGRTEWSQVPVDASMFPQWFDGESHRGSGAGLCCSGPWFVARMSGGPIKWSAGLYLLDCRATTISNPDRSACHQFASWFITTPKFN
jgi:hypothetical protein